MAELEEEVAKAKRGCQGEARSLHSRVEELEIALKAASDARDELLVQAKERDERDERDRRSIEAEAGARQQRGEGMEGCLTGGGGGGGGGELERLREEVGKLQRERDEGRREKESAVEEATKMRGELSGVLKELEKASRDKVALENAAAFLMSVSLSPAHALSLARTHSRLF